MAEGNNGITMEGQSQRQRQQELQEEVERMAKARSSFSYEAAAFDIEETRVIDFDDHVSSCFMYDCDWCDLKDKLDRQALEWQEKVEEILGFEWKDDGSSTADEYVDLLDTETNEAPDIDHLVELERRNNVFQYADLYVATITDHWQEGLPRSAEHNLSNLRSLVSNDEMNVLGKTYNWDEAIDYLSTEIHRELSSFPFELSE